MVNVEKGRFMIHLDVKSGWHISINASDQLKISFNGATIFQMQALESHYSPKTEDLRKITEWATQWKMEFNPEIAKQAIEVSFSNKRTPSNFEILHFNTIEVKQSSETKHLGMILDSNLNFNNHVAEKLSKSKQGLGVMQQLSKWVPRRSLEEIYKLYVRPHLDYGDIIFDVADLNKTSIFCNIKSIDGKNRNGPIPSCENCNGGLARHLSRQIV
jgi:hypothetical protein